MPQTPTPQDPRATLRALAEGIRSHLTSACRDEDDATRARHLDRMQGLVERIDRVASTDNWELEDDSGRAERLRPARWPAIARDLGAVHDGLTTAYRQVRTRGPSRGEAVLRERRRLRTLVRSLQSAQERRLRETAETREAVPGVAEILAEMREQRIDADAMSGLAAGSYPAKLSEWNALLHQIRSLL